MDLMHLVCPIFDFVGSSVKLGHARDWLTDNLASLVAAIVWWIQITIEDVSLTLVFTSFSQTDSVTECL
jgi:hypothetical protein